MRVFLPLSLRLCTVISLACFPVAAATLDDVVKSGVIRACTPGD